MRKLGVKIKTNNMLCNITMSLQVNAISCEIKFSLSSTLLYQITAPQVLTLRLLPLLYTLIKREFKVNISHHGDWAYMGTGRKKEKTHCIPSHGMRS